jgi:DNA invertase Pin-like site-specific DNA recombinase
MKKHTAAAPAPDSRAGLTLVGTPRAGAGATLPGVGTAAAIYARKSTEQDVDDEQKSVARQVDHGRQFAARHGWHVADDAVFIDDGISGTEFKTRPSYLRLMAALKPRAPFGVLIVMEESRLGRESIETQYALKQLMQAGVRVFCYLDGGRERRLDSPTDKLMLSLMSFTDEMESDKARQRAYDAALRKARAGYCTGRRKFGYQRHPIVINGKRSHTEWRIDAREAPVVRRVFARSLEATGSQRIARELNDDGIRPVEGGRWSPTTIQNMLVSPMYRGEIVWNKSHARDEWRARKRVDVPESEWIRVPVPQLRIVDDVTWYAVQQRRRKITEHLTAISSSRGGARRDRDSAYLLTSFAACGQCDGPISVVIRPASYSAAAMRQVPRPTVKFYGCLNYQHKGRHFCTNATTVRVDVLERAILDAIAATLDRPSLVGDVLGVVRDELRPAKAAATATTTRKAIAKLEKETRRLTDVIASSTGRQVAPLLAGFHDRQERLTALRAQLEATSTRATLGVSAADLERHVRQETAARRHLLADGVIGSSRAFLRTVLAGKIVLAPVADAAGRRDSHAVRFTGRLNLREFCGLSSSARSGTVSGAMWEVKFTGKAA